MLDPAGAVAPDLAEKLPGRGAWVGAERALVEQAAKRGAFSRAFSTAAPASEDLADDVETLLRIRALAAIGMARKSGAAQVGFDQVKALLQGAAPALLISAGDAAEDGAAKLARLARRGRAYRLFDSAALSEALGRDGVKHAAIALSRQTGRLARDVERYAAYIAAEERSAAAL